MTEWRTLALGEVLKASKEPVAIQDDVEYEQITVRIRGRGLISRRRVRGAKIATKRQFRVHAGQLLVSKIDARNGGLGLVPETVDGGVVSGDFPVYDVDAPVCLPRYLELYVSRPDFWDECFLVSEGSTNRVRLVPEQFLDLEIEVPPIKEQWAIVGVIGLITASVAAATRVAAAVEAAFKAGSVQAFADIEAEERRLGDIARLVSGGTPSRSVPEHFGGDISWVKTGEVRFNLISDTEENITELGLRASSAQLLPAGSVLLAMYGQGATRGRCALLAREMTTNQACAAILPCDQMLPEFTFFFLWSRYEEIRMESEGSAQDNLNQQMVADIEIPLPALDVQAAIVCRCKALRRAAVASAAEARSLHALRAALIEEFLSGVRPAPRLVKSA